VVGLVRLAGMSSAGMALTVGANVAEPEPQRAASFS
jgi:hypothetical protein